MYDAPMRTLVAVPLLLLAISSSAAKPTARPEKTPVLTPVSIPTASHTPTTATPTASPSPSPTAVPSLIDQLEDRQGLIAGLGLVLIGLGIILQAFGLLTTKKSADAATTAAKALQAVERSRIIVEPGPAPIYTEDPIPELNNDTILKIPYAAMNRGKSPATILNNFVKVAIVPAGAVPENLPIPAPIHSEGRRPMAVLVSEGVNYEKNVGISPAELQGIIAHELVLLLYGTIEYEDVFGITRIHGFAWKYTFLPDPLVKKVFKLYNDHEWVLEPGPDPYFRLST